MRLSTIQKGLLVTPIPLFGGCTSEQMQKVAKPMDKPISTQECGLDRLEHLVGQKFEALVIADLPENTRVITPGTMVTRDYRVERMNIDVNEAGILQRVWCG